MDANVFDFLSRISSPTDQPTKEAFTPSPAMEEAIMGGMGQPGAGGPPGGMPPGGPPPGGDPAAMGGMPPGAGGAAPTPGDPAAAAAPPPTDAPDPIAALTGKLDQMFQMMQQNAAGGQAGKSTAASIKFEPAHFQQMQHKISIMESVLRRMSEAMGIEVPASELFNVSAPGQPLPTAPGGAPGAPPGPGQPPVDPSQQAGAAPPSQIAQQLPQLPPMAPKAAAVDAISETRRLAGILNAGSAVGAGVGDHPTRGAGLAAIASAHRAIGASR